jgi:hypothetical protein
VGSILTNAITKKFLECRQQMDDKDDFFFTVAFLLAPTIAAQKAASLICFSQAKRDSLSLWQKYRGELLADTKLKYFEVSKIKNNLVVLFYQPDVLKKIIRQQAPCEFLQQFGYNTPINLKSYLEHLKRRYHHGCPPEIGLFLGIPVNDVISFINNRGQNFIFSGYWKVYHDAERAKNIFAAYDRARAKVLDLLAAGVNPCEIIKVI